MWVFPKNRGTPKWMIYNGKKNLVKWMIWGYSLFLETPIYIYTMDAQHLRFYETVLSHVRVMLITSLVET